MCAVCGSSATIDVNGALSDAHNWTLAWNGTETDVRTFGSSEWGDFITCANDGTLVVNTYEPITGLSVGDIVTYDCGAVIANYAGDAITTQLNVAVDSKGVIEWTHTMRLTGNISIT